MLDCLKTHTFDFCLNLVMSKSLELLHCQVDCHWYSPCPSLQARVILQPSKTGYSVTILSASLLKNAGKEMQTVKCPLTRCRIETITVIKSSWFRCSGLCNDSWADSVIWPLSRLCLDRKARLYKLIHRILEAFLFERKLVTLLYSIYALQTHVC